MRRYKLWHRPAVRAAGLRNGVLWGRSWADRLPTTRGIAAPSRGGAKTKSLQKYVANKLRHRQESDLLRLGYCDIEAPDDDTLLITRRMKDGHDALGRESTVTGKEIIKVCRKLH